MEMEIYCLMGTEFQLEKVKKFWRWIMVMAVLRCECNATEV